MNGPSQLRFSNEDLFQEAILGLLARIRGIFDIQDLHGPSEVGKDIAFKYSGPFGEVVNCACVVKNTPIVAKLTSRNSAQNVLQQIRQSLANEFPDNSGAKTAVNSVYVLTPERVSHQAIISIAGELREKSVQVRFIGGQDLIRLFQEHWPGFLADEAGAITRYATAMEQLLVNRPEIFKLSRLYPDMSAGEMGTSPYVPTGFRLPLRTYTLAPLANDLRIYSLSDLFVGPVAHNELEDIQNQAETVRLFAQHLLAWGYISSDCYIDLIDTIDRLMGLLHDSWNESPIAPTLDLSREYRKLKHRSTIVDASSQLGVMMRNAVETVETCLAHAKALAREETLLALDFPKGEHLLNYGHAANCLDAFLSASTATDENDSLIREFCLTHEELRDYRGLVLIVGPPGYGKTSYCRWSALEDLKVWRSQHDRCHLPIYIRLNTLDVIALSSEQELFAAGLQSGLLHEEDWRLVMTGEVPVRLYLDGLDEVSSEDGRKMIVALSRRLASAKPDWQLILTSRDYMRAEWLQGIARIELLGFSNFEVQQLATAMLQGCEHLSTQFLAQLAATKYLSDLSRVPLLATLMILVFRKNGDLPGKRASLYSTFIELLCGGWDFVKGVQRGITFGRDVKIAILTRAAWVAHESHARFFDLEQFSEVCIVAAPGVFAACSRDDRTRKIVDLIDELLIDGLLRRSGQLMQFAHMSFQEFLAAKELAQGSLKNRIDSILTQYLYGDDWWREVLLFVIGLASDPESVADWIHQQFTDAGVEGHQARVREKQLLGELEKLFPGIVATR